MTGLFIALFAGFTDRLKSKKNIRDLKAANDSQLEELSALKSKVELLQSVSPKPAETVMESAE